MYLLDTNVCVRLINDASAAMAARVESHKPSELKLCSVVKAELLYGARKSGRSAGNLRRLERFFSLFGSLPFDDDCGEAYGRIREELERAGTPIGPNDVLIAAIAVANDATLITHNVGEFSQVIGLTLEDWDAG